MEPGTKLIENCKGNDLLTLKDYHADTLSALLNLSQKLKTDTKQGIAKQYLQGKTLGMMFEKPSTRTRCSFETGIYQLGGMGMFLSKNDLQLSRKEPIKDTARVLSSYLDGIVVRTFEHSKIEKFAQYSSVPVINGLTDTFHPCQVMADLLTIKEQFRTLKGLKLTYLGDGNNMTNSLLIGCVKMGMEITVASPTEYLPTYEIVKLAKEEADKTGGKVTITDDPDQALKNSHIITTDVWVSMGEGESSKSNKLKAFKPYQLNKEAICKADKDVVVLHCLPAHRGEEITDEVLEGKQSRVFQQAENRLHAQKGIMVALMG
ncbi:ornithine carbamoyltransferase [Natranaerobius trueperi]|uniref:ornithine carbamoyltransferase n=1 Tax=Natranaerobius trueperi TaxID=759412 RepID=UPI001F0AFA68|nr:ornithine carbamoyltransferase [Natranaerobius trueperi]